MATKKLKKNTKNNLVAKLIEEDSPEGGPCSFCQRTVNNELLFGKLYSIGDLYCHYFCVLLSCCLVQKGEDDEGLLGFLYTDIVNEIERSKKHKCSYCGVGGATLGCSEPRCRKQFHLPCGQERSAVSMYYGTYKSFCEKHAPQQRITAEVMANAKPRMIAANKLARLNKSAANTSTASSACVSLDLDVSQSDGDSVCVICYEPVACYPTPRTFWPPCCARDAWFHRMCLQRMALSAGMHYIKCPLCNDKDTFYRAVVSQGYYLPDRDAAWELERNAFRDIYERQVSCDLPECKCPQGRGHDDTGEWDIKVCLVCGTVGAHVGCLPSSDRFLCDSCREALAKHPNYTLVIQALTELEQSESRPTTVAPATPPPRPVMPARMSVRRTKPMHALRQSASCSKREAAPVTSLKSTSSTEGSDTKKDTVSSRLDLNLKPPRKPTSTAPPSVLRFLDTNVLRNLEKNLPESPMKLLIERVNNKLLTHSVENAAEISKKLLKTLSQLDYKPKPKSAKQHYLDSLLDEIFKEVSNGQLNSLMSPNKFGSPHRYGSPTGHLKLKFNYQKTPDRTKTGNTQSSQTTPKSEAKNKSPKNENITKAGNTGTPQNKTTNSTALTPKNITPTYIALTPKLESPNSINQCNRNTKLTTVNIQNDNSMEISAHNNSVAIDFMTIDTSNTTDITKTIAFKSPTATPKCTLKISPNNKDRLTQALSLDVERFKNEYLKEVEAKKCSFNHKHSHDGKKSSKFQTVIDFAVEAAVKNKTKSNADRTNKKLKKNKRKTDSEDDPISKKRKKHSSPKIKLIYKDTDSAVSQRDHQSVKRLKKKSRNKKRKRTNNVSIRDKDLKVKIKWKEERLKLKITKFNKSKKRRKERDNLQQVFTQTLLNFSPDCDSKDVIERPDKGATPLKRKYVRHEKYHDHLKQTTLQNFFKVKTE